MSEWDKLVSGETCPFDHELPEHSSFGVRVKKLSVSSIILQHNQAYYGHCMLIFEPRHVVRVDQLTPQEWQSLMNDVYIAERAIHKVTQPDHINVASLGNVTPHLHWHIIPRYRDDPRWRQSIWTTNDSDIAERELAPQAHSDLVDKLRSTIDALS